MKKNEKWFAVGSLSVLLTAVLVLCCTVDLGSAMADAFSTPRPNTTRNEVPMETDLNAQDKAFIYEGVDNVTDLTEFERLKNAGKLLESGWQPGMEAVQSKEAYIFQKNLSIIDRALKVYKFLSDNYGSGYARDNVITSDAVNLKYIEKIISALEYGMTHDDFVDFEEAVDLAEYVNERQFLIEGTELESRFYAVVDYYKAKLATNHAN